MKLKNDAISVFNNKTEGSSTLLIKLNHLIKSDFKNKKYIALLIKESRVHFNSFAVVLNYLDELEKGISNGKAFPDIIKNIEDHDKNVNLRLFENSRKYFRNVSTVLTISNSQTILTFLRQFHSINKKLNVIIAESRPKNEGKILAKRLLKEGISVGFITDFSTASYLPLIDAAVIGADKILSTGNVINKTGSRTLAILCRYYNKPFYVLTSRGKQVYDKKYIPEQKDPSEVWNYSTKNLTIKNSYFEEVESDLITKIITD